MLLLFTGSELIGQEIARIKGRVYDAQGLPVDAANVSIIGASKGVTTDDRGRFELEVPANQEVEIGLSHNYFLQSLKNHNHRKV